jgi:hypothetical protein
MKTYPACGICEGNAIALVPDGGYIITGTSLDNQGRTHLLVQKTDAAGNERWSVTTGTPSCAGNAVVPASPSGVAVLGECATGSGAATLTIMDSENGRVQHSWNYDDGQNASGSALVTAPGGGYFIADETDSRSAGRSDRDVSLREVNAAGSMVWGRLYSGSRDDSAKAVLSVQGGGYVIGGSTGTGGSKRDDILLLKIDASGKELWSKSFGTDADDTTDSIIATGDGGYLVAASACKQGQANDCTIYLAKTDTAGNVMWDHRYGESGRDAAAAVVTAPDGGYTIAGSTRSPAPGAQDQDILILHIDGSGTELWSRTIGTSADESVSGAVLTDNGSLVVAGSASDPAKPGSRTLFIVSLGNGGRDSPDGLLKSSSPQEEKGVKVTVIDAKSGAVIPGALVYYDGKLAGSTSESEGTYHREKTEAGSHSFRITKDGYRETTIMAGSDTGSDLTVHLQPSAVHRLMGAGTPEQSLDIVFVPSNTSYDCTIRQKTVADRYIGHEEAFQEDTRRIIANQLLQISRFTVTPARIPQNYPQRINIYYYWDETRFADAFSGCAGTLPEGFWDEVPYADVAVILYPTYTGRYSGSSCEPHGCSNGVGPGMQSWLKAPADKGQVFLHESGHAIFGLMDTYCGDTYYAENQPFPNIWGSETGCRKDLLKNGLNVTLCRPLAAESSFVTTGCGQGFWKSDTSPDLMGGTGLQAKFGEASTLRIEYILNGFRGG